MYSNIKPERLVPQSIEQNGKPETIDKPYPNGSVEDDLIFKHDKEEEGFNYYQQSEPVEVSKDCLVKTVIGAVVVTTAILMVVIAASNRDPGKNTRHRILDKDNVYWSPSQSKPRLVFNDQFLIHDVTNRNRYLVLGADDFRKIYVLEFHVDDSKHYNSYLIVNFEEKTETLMIVSKSENIFGTEVEETKILSCHTTRFERSFQGQFASALDIRKSPTLHTHLNCTNTKLEITYVGAHMTLEHYASLVTNSSSCTSLPRKDVFSWKSVDESLGCGVRISTKTNIQTCEKDLCQKYPGIPLSKGTACHKFRRCNYVIRHCDPYYQHRLNRLEDHPYCVCRKTTTEDAKRLSCPRVEDDGGECEIPRRDLVESQSNSPCWCFYRFIVVYPYRLGPGLGAEADSTKGMPKNGVQWRVREETVTAPSLRFQECQC